ncbi:MAG: acyltransferase family protein [Ilumatobacteraceae bacterium]
MEQRRAGRVPEGASLTFRPDVEGLRAVAVVAVVVYHAWPEWLPGGFVGVDVFFVVSGFLITSLLLREFDTTGTVSLRRFWARRARRLLPAATVTLVATALAGRLLLDGLSTGELARDIAAAAAFASNIRFGVLGNDYLASSLPPSPVLHFWSLAVEEQFYVVWPCLVLAALKARRVWGRGRQALTVLVAVIGVGSFVWGFAWTSTNRVWAFFLLPTRAWELLAGAAVALAAPACVRTLRTLGRSGAGRFVPAGLCLVGLGMIEAAMVVFDDSPAFPGAAAVLPVAGTALVIVGGTVGPLSLLTLRPLQWIGTRSYSIYLWHFPFLVLAERRWGPLGGSGVLAAVAGAVIVATLMHRWVEDPLRRSPVLTARPARSLGVGAVGVAASLGSAMLLLAAPPSLDGGADAATVTLAGVTTTSGGEAGGSTTIVASTAVPDTASSSTTVAPTTTMAWVHSDQADADDPPWLAPLVAANLPTLEQALLATEVPGNAEPSLAEIRDDVPVAYDDGCHVGIGGSRALDCVYGDPQGAYRIVLFGDSHMAQWLPAFADAGERLGWQVRLHTKRACPWTFIPTEKDQIGNNCAGWQQNVVEAIAADPPDLLIVSGYRYKQVGWAAGMAPDEVWRKGGADALEVLRPLASTLVILGDSSTPALDVPSCLASHRSDVGACVATRDQAIRPTRQQVERELAEQFDALFVPTSNWTCTATACPVVVGNVLMYRDDSHLTATATALLTPYVEALVGALR